MLKLGQKSWQRFPEALISAFSLYSTLPMPQLEFRPEGLRYTLAAFPLLGLVEGCLAWALLAGAQALHFGPFVLAALLLAWHFLYTGGMHLDGFADSADAIFSRRDQARQLEIMHDPHMGVMAACALLCWGALYLALWSELLVEPFRLLPGSAYLALPFGLALARVCSGSSLLLLPKARPDGLAKTVADATQGRRLQALYFGLQILLYGLALAFILGWVKTLILLAAFALVDALFLLYCRRHFQGITGDLAGALFSLLQLLFPFLLNLYQKGYCL